MQQQHPHVQGISAEEPARLPAPPEVQRLMDQFGWPEYVARRHLEQRERIVRAGHRSAALIAGSAA